MKQLYDSFICMISEMFLNLAIIMIPDRWEKHWDNNELKFTPKWRNLCMKIPFWLIKIGFAIKKWRLK